MEIIGTLGRIILTISPRSSRHIVQRWILITLSSRMHNRNNEFSRMYNLVPRMEKICCGDILMNSYLGNEYPITDSIKCMAETALKF